MNDINNTLRSKSNQVNCKYGAPLGRVNVVGDGTGKLHLQRVRINSGGYDPSGTYWGRGLPLYCAFGDDGTEVYHRAGGRDDAKRAVLRDMPNARFYR